MAGSELRSILEAPGETLRLVEALGARLRSDGAPWGTEQAGRLAESYRAGRLAGLLWTGPKDEAVGLALWEAKVPLGRRATIYLDDGYRSEGTLGGFVDRLLKAEGEGPLLSVLDPVPGLVDEAVDRALGPRGFQRLLRADLIYPAARPVPELPPDPRVRPVRREDGGAVALLLEEAYRDNPGDRALFQHELDWAEDCRYATGQLLDGSVGTWWPSASFAIPDPSRPDRFLAMTLVNDLRGPLMTEVVVAPDGRRQGLARRLVLESVRAVRDRTPMPVRLVVTLRNRRAARLYESMGFVRSEEPVGGPWILPASYPFPVVDPPFDG